MKLFKRCVYVVILVVMFSNVVSLAAENEQSYKEVWIGEGTTFFNPKDINKAINVKLAAMSLDYLVINNGEEFSFNKSVGERTWAKGYRKAKTFSGKNVILEIGGGICQVSTTLNKLAVSTNMKIIEAHMHSNPVTYATREEEASVYYGKWDFRFVNTSGDPIRIETQVDTVNGRLTFWFWQRVPIVNK